ncbi:MAG: hypothetical protein IJ422_04590 [Oscillospiraceae bacterium]|nr:hypothetical protein [Oscillospiraceae bacterium]
MTSMELLELLGSVRDNYVVEAHSDAAPVKTISLKRTFLIAALIALALLLVGCTVAYVQGWFTDFFAARSDEPLSSEQIEFIQENEQIIMETQSKGGWTVELKSAIRDSETAYVIFGVTAPEDVDLEEANITTYTDSDEIIPGNEPSMVHDPKSRTMFATSAGIPSGLGNAVPEQNIIWNGGGKWEADNDGRANTLNYVFTIGIEKLDPSKEILLEDPFASDIEFYFCFENFIHTWEDAEKRAEIDAKYAGQDYIIDGEEMDGLYKSEILIEETWEFTVTFDDAKQSNEDPNSVELIIGEPVMTWGIVSWKLTDDPLFYETGNGMAAVKITSFVLSPFGATITYEFEEPAYNAFIEYQDMFGYEDRYIYAVMKDGSQIALHTDSVGTQLTAETPIVLSEVDHILLGDGATIPMPE